MSQYESRCGKEGAFQNILLCKAGLESLRDLFPDGKADEFNFVLFSTSGVYGSYITLEQVEESLRKFGRLEGDERPDDYLDSVTFLIVHPRIVGLRFGNAENLTLEDVEFLKGLRESSWKCMADIGRRQFTG